VDATNNLIVEDGAGGPVTVGVANGSLTVRMLNGSTGAVSVTLDGAISGNLTVNLGSGDRALDLNGALNTIGGSLSITGGTGDQTVELATAAPLVVGGTANIDLGAGLDAVTNAADVTIGQDLNLRGVNDFAGANTVTVGRNVSVYVNTESVDSTFNSAGGTAGVIGGNFNYVGSSAQDNVLMNFLYTVGGSVNINLGGYVIDSDATAGDQVADLTLATVGGNVTVLAALNTLGDDIFLTAATTVIGGSVYVNLGGGDNQATFLGTVGGSSITYTGGFGIDTVVLGTTGSAARFTANLSLGADAFTLEAGTTLSFLNVDFGPGVDVFTNNFGGPFTFPAILRNLP
jgi:hypothetical protein